jgi:hypothetical protein
MTAIEGLQTALNGLGLKAIEARLENLLEQASKKEPSYADFLQDLLSCEVDARRTGIYGPGCNWHTYLSSRPSISSTSVSNRPLMNARCVNCVPYASSMKPPT